MKKQMFEELLGSLREAGAILRGQKKTSRRVVIRPAPGPTALQRSMASEIASETAPPPMRSCGVRGTGSRSDG